MNSSLHVWKHESSFFDRLAVHYVKLWLYDLINYYAASFHSVFVMHPQKVFSRGHLWLMDKYALIWDWLHFVFSKTDILHVKWLYSGDFVKILMKGFWPQEVIKTREMQLKYLASILISASENENQ